jgi:hypothetical protein
MRFDTGITTGTVSMLERYMGMSPGDPKYHATQQELVARLLPLVKRLAASGLLDIADGQVIGMAGWRLDSAVIGFV